VLLRQLKPKYAEKLLVESGVISRDQSGARLFDRFRRRITFPIANESGKIVAFGCRALGDDLPKYLNSPRQPSIRKVACSIIWTGRKSQSGGRTSRFLVEGYWTRLPWRGRESATWWRVAAPALPSRRLNCWGGSRNA